jgi:hypothetical protein
MNPIIYWKDRAADYWIENKNKKEKLFLLP